MYGYGKGHLTISEKKVELKTGVGHEKFLPKRIPTNLMAFF